MEGNSLPAASVEGASIDEITVFRTPKTPTAPLVCDTPSTDTSIVTATPNTPDLTPCSSVSKGSDNSNDTSHRGDCTDPAKASATTTTTTEATASPDICKLASTESSTTGSPPTVSLPPSSISFNNENIDSAPKDIENSSRDAVPKLMFSAECTDNNNNNSSSSSNSSSNSSSSSNNNNNNNNNNESTHGEDLNHQDTPTTVLEPFSIRAIQDSYCLDGSSTKSPSKEKDPDAPHENHFFKEKSQLDDSRSTTLDPITHRVNNLEGSLEDDTTMDAIPVNDSILLLRALRTPDNATSDTPIKDVTDCGEAAKERNDTSSNDDNNDDEHNNNNARETTVTTEQDAVAAPAKKSLCLLDDFRKVDAAAGVACRNPDSSIVPKPTDEVHESSTNDDGDRDAKLHLPAIHQDETKVRETLIGMTVDTRPEPCTGPKETDSGETALFDDSHESGPEAAAVDVTDDDIKFEVLHHKGTKAWLAAIREAVVKELTMCYDPHTEFCKAHFRTVLANLQSKRKFYFAQLGPSGDNEWVLANEAQIENCTEEQWGKIMYRELKIKRRRPEVNEEPLEDEVSSSSEQDDAPIVDMEQQRQQPENQPLCDKDDVTSTCSSTTFRPAIQAMKTIAATHYEEVDNDFEQVDDASEQVDNASDQGSTSSCDLQPDEEALIVNPKKSDICFGLGDHLVQETPRKSSIFFVPSEGSRAFMNAVRIVAKEDFRNDDSSKKVSGISIRNRILARLKGRRFYRCYSKGGNWEDAGIKSTRVRCMYEYHRCLAELGASSVSRQTKEAQPKQRQPQARNAGVKAKKKQQSEAGDDDVCFGDKDHPGTTAWRNTVKICVLENHKQHELLTKPLLQSILKKLQRTSNRRFFVRCNKKSRGWWRAATDLEIAQRTERRYKDWASGSKSLSQQEKARSAKTRKGRYSTRFGQNADVALCDDMSPRARRLAQKRKAKPMTSSFSTTAKRAKTAKKTEGPPVLRTERNIGDMINAMIEDCDQKLNASTTLGRAPLLNGLLASPKKEFLQALQAVPWSHVMHNKANDSNCDMMQRQGAHLFAEQQEQSEGHLVNFLETLAAWEK